MEKEIRLVILSIFVVLAGVSSCLASAGESDACETVVPEQEESLEFITEGTRWESAYYCRENPNDFWAVSEYDQHMWLEGTEVINDKTYMKLWEKFFSKEGPTTEFFAYIRAEGQKVYMLPLDSIETSGERLIYDFSLGLGESTEVSMVEDWRKGFDNWVIRSVVTCNDIRPRFTCGRTFDLMEMGAVITTEYGTEDLTDLPLLWIRGLGTTSGFLNNVLDGNNMGFWLKKIYHNETLIYDNTSGINDIVNDEMGTASGNTGNKYHLDGTPFNDGDTGIYIQNGKKYYKSPNARE